VLFSALAGSVKTAPKYRKYRLRFATRGVSVPGTLNS
jgi:hypothetical protein